MEFPRVINMLKTLSFLNCLSHLDRQRCGPVTRSEWHYYGGDEGGSRYSNLSQINRENVRELRRAWTYHTGELN
jgi:quinoprotein glucose dehydrogenase